MVLHPGQVRATDRLRRARHDPVAFVASCLVDGRGRPLRSAPVHGELHDFLSAHRNAVIELPRDHGKSTQVCGRIVWELGRDPGLRVTLVCATEGVARERCRYLRELIGSNARVRATFPGLVPGEPWTAGAFGVARPGAGIGPSVAAFGIEAANTGTRCDLLVCDDVVAHDSLHSKANRDRAASVFANNLMNLLEPDGRCWCLCTPWHRDDLNARLKMNPSFALFRRAVGPELEPVWPEKWPPEALARRRDEVGEAAFARGYRLVPVAEDDVLIDPSWVWTWDALPPLDDVVLAVDPAVTARAEADASALVVLGRAGNVVYCLEAVARRVKLPDLIGLIRTVESRWPVSKVLFEANAAFKGIADLLGSQGYFGPRLVPVVQSQAKWARVAGLSVRVQGKAFLLRAGPAGEVDAGQRELWDEMVSFPVGPSDDLVDAAAMGVEYLLKDAGRREPRIW